MSAVLMLPALGCGPDAGPAAPDGASGEGSATALLLLESTPRQGSSIVPEVCPQGLCTSDLTLTFEASSQVALESAVLKVELLAEESCGSAYGSPDSPAAGGSAALRFTVRDFVFGGLSNEACAYPGSVASVTTRTARASLSLEGRVLARTDFALQYTFAGPPVADRVTTPVVSGLCWEIPGPSGGWCGDRPLQGDSTSYRCEVSDDDGDGLEVSLSFRSMDGCLSDDHCWTASQSFAPRLVPLPVGLETTHVYPETSAARLTCQAVDSRGRSTLAEACFGAC